MLHDDRKMPMFPAEHHKAWMELICNNSIEKLMIISPPGSAKTTWLVQAYLGCRLGFYPDQNYIIGSVTDEVAEKRSLSLRGDIESDVWKEIFPDVVPNNKLKWEQREWSIKGKYSSYMGRLHPTIRAYGVGSSSIGGRADMLLGDDLLSRENTSTQGQRDKVADWIESSFLTRKKPQGRAILIGTAWNASDYYAKIRRELKGWTIIHCSSYQPEGFYIHVLYPDKHTDTKQIHSDTVLWKAHQTEKETLAIKNTTQEHIWETTWQGNPTSPKGQMFKRSWWENKNRFVNISDVIATYISADTGLSDTESSAMSAISVLGLTSNYKLKLLDVWADKVQFPQLVDKTIELADKYNYGNKNLLYGIIIENKLSGVSLIQVLLQTAPEWIKKLVNKYTPRMSKELRWGESAVWCDLNCIELPSPSPEYYWLMQMEKDIFECPDLEYKDRMDSFAQGVLFLENYLSTGLQGR